MIKRVLFLNPPDQSLLLPEGASGYSYFEPPLGLLYVYSYIKENTRLKTRFLDLNIDLRFFSSDTLEKRLSSVINEFKPDLVAIASLYYSAIDVFHEVAGVVKNCAPQSIVVMGGHYPTHLTSQCLADKNVDYAILSEGELGLKELIETINTENDPVHVEGIAFLCNGRIQKKKRKIFRNDFSEHAMLAWEDTHFSYYFREGRNVLQRLGDHKEMKLAAVTATRGCPNACTFCSSQNFWNRNWRKRRVNFVVEEIQHLIDQYGINTVIFNDENIAVNRQWFHDLLDALEKLPVRWISSGGLSIRAINDVETIEKMYSSGIGLFNLAIESGNNETLKRVQKPLTIEETQQVIQRIRTFGKGYIIGFAIVGFPFENWHGVRNTLDFMENLDLDWKSFYCFQPFPGCDLADFCVEHGLTGKFNANYGDVYTPPEMQYIDYSKEDLAEINYLANLRTNFVENRNLLLATEKSLEQAERDFNYVLGMVPQHPFALLGLAKVMQLRGEPQNAYKYLMATHKVLDASSFDWSLYMKQLDIDLKTISIEIEHCE